MKDNRQVIDDIDIRNNCTIIKRGSAAMPQVYPNAKDVDYLFILGRRVQLTASGFKKLLLLIPIPFQPQYNQSCGLGLSNCKALGEGMGARAGAPQRPRPRCARRDLRSLRTP